MESLLFLNEASAKSQEWQVRVMYPRLIRYQFTTRKNETVNACKFEARLVSRDATEYVAATVPFSFRDPDKPARALQKFSSGTAWNISSVLLDSNSKAQWNGCPNKVVVVLESPTKASAIMQGIELERSLVTHIDPPLRLADVLEVRETQTVDCIVMIEEVQPVRREVARGKEVQVCSVTVVDDSNSRATITCWEEQAQAVQGHVNKAVLILGLIAVCDNGQVKLSVRASSIIDFTKSPRHEALEQAVKDRSDTEVVQSITQSWIPTASAPSCDGEAVMVCAAFLKAIRGEERYASREPFQLMGVYANANLSEIHTKDGSRLYLTGWIRDWSGAVQVSFLESAAPDLLGCGDKEEVEDKASRDELSVTGSALNVRGFKQGSDFHIAQIVTAEILTEPSQSAWKLADLASVCGQSADGVMACAACELHSSGLLNLGVKLSNGTIVKPHQAMLLVKGTQKSKLITQGTTTSSRIVVSEGAKCLLSPESVTLNVRAYASEDMLLEYKLDNEAAIIFVSGLKQATPGVWTCVIEKMQKVTGSKEELAKAIKCMKALQRMSTNPRECKDEKRACEMVTPDSMKRARCIQAYPSDA